MNKIVDTVDVVSAKQKVKADIEDSKKATAEDEMTEEEQARKFKEDVEKLAKGADTRRHKKDVTKFTDAVEKDPTSVIKKEKLEEAKTAVHNDEVAAVDEKNEEESKVKAEKSARADVEEAKVVVKEHKEEVVNVERVIAEKVADAKKEAHLMDEENTSAVKAKIA